MPDLIELSIEQACAAKWDLGQAKYGPVFVGNPIVQLDEELLDGLNYCEEAARWGYDLGDIPERLRGICEEVRRIYRSRAVRSIAAPTVDSWRQTGIAS